MHTSVLLMSPFSSSIAIDSIVVPEICCAGPCRVGTLGHAHCLLTTVASWMELVAIVNLMWPHRYFFV